MGNEVLFVLLFAKELFDPRSGAVSAVLGQGRSKNWGPLCPQNAGDAEGGSAAEAESRSVTGAEK